jgi:hypothetical protein
MKMEVAGKVIKITNVPKAKGSTGPTFARCTIINEDFEQSICIYNKEQLPLQLDDSICFVENEIQTYKKNEKQYVIPLNCEVVLTQSEPGIINAIQLALGSTHEDAKLEYQYFEGECYKKHNSVVEWLDDVAEGVGKKRKAKKGKKKNEEKVFSWWVYNRLRRQVVLLMGGSKKSLELIEKIRAHYGWGYTKLFENLTTNPLQVVPLPLPEVLRFAAKFEIEYDEKDIKLGELIRFVYAASDIEGHSCVTMTELKRCFSQELIDEAIELQDYKMKFGCVIDPMIYSDLEVVANDISSRLMTAPPSLPITPQFTESKLQKIELTDIQKSATEMALNNRAFLLTGPAGSGKTTIIKEIIYNLKKMKKTYLMVAFTGIAVARMKEVTGDDNCLTIHMTLGGLEEDKLFKVDLDQFVSTKNVAADYLIMDETSMTMTALYAKLCRAHKFPNVIFVGDKNQLQPVGYGSLMREIMKTEKVPTIHLDKNHRAKNVMYKIVDGKFIENEHFRLIEGGMDKAIDLYQELLNKKVKPQDIMIITSHKALVHELNEICQKLANKSSECVVEGGGRILKLNDKVMMKKNNYSVGQMNGDMGVITEIGEKKSGGKKMDKTITVKFKSGSLVEFYVANQKEIDAPSIHRFRKVNTSLLNLAYAVTVHKSQGNQAKIVLFYIQPRINDGKILNQCLIYTALTRAQEKIYCIGNMNTLNERSRLGCPDRCDVLAPWIREYLGEEVLVTN